MKYLFADCELETDSRRLLRDGVAVAVEPQVFDLLQLLVENPARLVTRDEIIAAVWGGRIVSESAISARIAAARRAVGDDGKAQAIIKTHHGRGLEFVAPQDTDPGAPDASAASETAETPSVRYTMSKRGQSLAYLLSGAGTPLMHLDGPGLNKDQAWRIPIMRKNFEACREGHRFLQMDWAGTGLSEAFDVAPSLEENAEDMASVADAAGFDRFAIMTESGSCLEAVIFATTYPERVSRLVIVGGYAEGRLRRQAEAGPEVLKTMMQAGWASRGGGLATAMISAYFPESAPEDIRQMAELMQTSASLDFALSHRDRMNTGSVRHLLDQVRCPTLIVQGRHDAIHPLQQAQILAAGIPDAALHVLETANHLPLVGHPTFPGYIAKVRAFLASDT